MSFNVFMSRFILILLSIYIGIFFLQTFSKAYYDEAYKKPDAYDLWSVSKDESDSYFLYNDLYDRGMIVDDLSFGDFDYICVLTQQLCTMTKNVKPELALAMIAVESNFDANNRTGRAYGLMQLIPIYHSARLAQYVEEGHQIDLDDFYNPRLNIMTGLDYMDSILDETGGDVIYALMWYSQGPTSASSAYLDNLHISHYAKKVMNLSEEIKQYLGKGGEMNVCTAGR